MEQCEIETGHTEGSFEAIRARNRKSTTPEERRASIVSAYRACSAELPVTVEAMAEFIGVTERCVRDRLKELKTEFWCKGGIVGLVSEAEN